MNIREIFTKKTDSERAVSPVIGVILMVAITVILAAVIASFVLGLGDNQQVTPTAQFSFDYEEVNENPNGGEYDGSAGMLTITHESGDTIPHNELYLRGDGIAGSGDDLTHSDWDNSSSTDWAFIDTATMSASDLNESVQIYESGGMWNRSQTSSSVGDTPAVVAGDSAGAIVDSDYEVRLVWEPQEGGSSATLADDSGPDA